MKTITCSIATMFLLGGGIELLKGDTPLRGEKRIREAVESGKITREEARKRLAGMRKAQNAEKPEGGRGLTVEEYQRREASIKEAVKAGKVSRDVAAKRLAGLQKMVRGKAEGKAPEGKGKNNGGAAKYRAMEEEIWAEVKKGQMSKEDAMEKLGQLKEEMFGGKGK